MDYLYIDYITLLRVKDLLTDVTINRYHLTYCAMKITLEKVTMTLLSSMVRQRYQETHSGKKRQSSFVMLGRKLNSYLIESVEDYLLANFMVSKGYIGNFNDQNYFDWKDRMSRLETLFKNEATKLFEDGTLDVLKVPDNSHPKLLKEYLGKEYHLKRGDTRWYHSYSSKWDKKMSDDS